MDQILHKTSYQSQLGQIVLLSTDTQLLGLWFNKQKYFGANYQLEKADSKMAGPLEQTLQWLSKYFSGQQPDPFAIPVAPKVTPFQQQVLEELQKVPYGQTTTYKELSNHLQQEKTSKTNLARAIGNAVGHNPISLIIPCHRVIGTNGSLTGYAGGLDRKKALLEMEQRYLRN